MDRADTVTRAPSAAWREVDGQVVIVSLDVNRVRLLNGVGSFVWKRCEGATVGALVDAVGDAFACDAARAEHDVLAFVADLAGRGMLVVGDGR